MTCGFSRGEVEGLWSAGGGRIPPGGGRPPADAELVVRTEQMARENPGCFMGLQGPRNNQVMDYPVRC